MSKKTFTVYKTLNGGFRAADVATNKVEPLVAGEASFTSACKKLDSLYPGCVIVADHENINATVIAYQKKLQSSPAYVARLTADIGLAARSVGADANAAIRLAKAIVKQVFLDNPTNL